MNRRPRPTQRRVRKTLVVSVPPAGPLRTCHEARMLARNGNRRTA